MPQGIWNASWLDQNANRNYPLSETASCKDSSGSFTLPRNLIVDLVLTMQASDGLAVGGFYVKNISTFGDGLTITIGYQGSSGEQTVGSVAVARSTHTKYQSYYVAGTGQFFDCLGKITLGDLADTLSAGGSYNFDLAGGRLEPTVVRPALRGVSALVAVNGQDRSSRLTGDIELIAGRNIQFTVSTTTDGVSQIRIDAIPDDSLTEECSCTNLPVAGTPIKTINGVAPNPDTGDIQLISADACLSITAGGTGVLILKDSCSKACCGCTELEKVVGDLNYLQSEISTLTTVANRLDAQTQTAILNLLASKTGELPVD